MSLRQIQDYLQRHELDGWLLYAFRDLNPIALSVAGLASAGSRRWFLWVPAAGQPSWLIHAIESQPFTHVPAEMQGTMHSYVSWQDLQRLLPELIGAQGGRRLRIAMEYSPDNAIPYVSRVDAGTKELVEKATGAMIVSSADLVQMVQAVLTPEQVAGHRRAAAICLAAKDAAYDLIARRLHAGEPVTEYTVQQFIVDYFGEHGLERATPIVAVNRNAANPHYFPTEGSHSPIQVGDVVLIDLWSRETAHPDDSFADCTWTAFCGTEVPPKVKAVFGAVAAGRDAAVRFIQQRLDAGQAVHGYEVDDVCRQVIVDAGYGQYILHRTGHSLGPTGHYVGVNIDNLETQDRRELIPGVMFTIEPGIYIPDYNFDDSSSPKGLGIRSEINCLMHADRVEVTTLPVQTEVKPLLRV